MGHALISVIIPVFNRSHLIRDTLDSVLKQSYKYWECIIVDDWSSDNTGAVVNKYLEKDNRFKYHQRPKNRLNGANTCRNYGLEKANGDYIQWFDSDDLMHPDLLQLQLQNLQSTQKLLSFCNFIFFRKISETTEKNGYNFYDKNTEGDFLIKQLVSGQIVLNTQTVCIDKKALSNFTFNENLHRAQDLDFVFRLLLIFPDKVCVLNKSLVYIRRHPQSITDTFKSGHIELIKSEVKVRNDIKEALIEHDYTKQHITGATKMYLKSLKYMLRGKLYMGFFIKIFRVFITVDNNLKLVTIKLAILGIFYTFIGKGLTAYQNQINKL